MLFWCGIFYYIAENSFSTTFRPEKTTFRPDFSHKALKYDIIQVPKEEQEVRKMKKLFQKYGGFIAALAIFVTSMNVNSACVCIMHQDSLPEDAKRLRKF